MQALIIISKGKLHIIVSAPLCSISSMVSIIEIPFLFSTNMAGAVVSVILYYRALSTWEPYIDVCLSISSKIKNTLLSKRFPSYKIKDLYWKIPCDKRVRGFYSPTGEPLAHFAEQFPVLIQINNVSHKSFYITDLCRESKEEPLILYGIGKRTGELLERIQEYQIAGLMDVQK